MSSILESALRPELVKLRLSGDTKQAVIHEMVQLLVDAGAVGDGAAVERAILDREQQLSTGLHDGIAIPHGKSDAVDKLHVAVALKPEGIDFDCVDRQPATILVMTISPSARTGPHIRFMADISRVLRRVDVREALLKAETREEIVSLLVTESS